MNDIAGAAMLLEHFGYWPSFHDAEVLHVSLDRHKDAPPTLTLRVHAFDSTGELDARGYGVLQKHCVATMRFTDVADVELAGFNVQNVLGGLTIAPVTVSPDEKRAAYMTGSLDRFRREVVLDGLYGLHGSFVCHNAEVVSVEALIGAPA
jgi:hypothetical protein